MSVGYSGTSRPEAGVIIKNMKNPVLVVFDSWKMLILYFTWI
jgi:hypothetical protein